MTLYRLFERDVSNSFQGVQSFNASNPCWQNKFNRLGLNPDIQDVFFWEDNVGNPSVDFKFQKSR